MCSTGASKAPVLRVNNNNDNLSIDVLYFVPENLKKVQESCWYFRIFAKVQVSERWRHIFLGTLLRMLVQDFMFCSIWALHHHDVSQTMMTFRTTRWLSSPVCFSSCQEHCSTFVWYQFLQVWTMFFHVLSYDNNSQQCKCTDTVLHLVCACLLLFIFRAHFFAFGTTATPNAIWRKL